MSNDDEEKTQVTTDDGFTANENVRWDHLASVIAIVVMVTFMALTLLLAVGEASMEPITSGWFALLWLVVSATVAWLFGVDLATKYSEYKK